LNQAAAFIVYIIRDAGTVVAGSLVRVQVRVLGCGQVQNTTVPRDSIRTDHTRFGRVSSIRASLTDRTGRHIQAGRVWIDHQNIAQQIAAGIVHADPKVQCITGYCINLIYRLGDQGHEGEISSQVGFTHRQGLGEGGYGC